MVNECCCERERCLGGGGEVKYYHICPRVFHVKGMVVTTLAL